MATVQRKVTRGSHCASFAWIHEAMESFQVEREAETLGVTEEDELTAEDEKAESILTESIDS